MDPPRYHHLSKVGKKIGLENEFFSVTAFADYRYMPTFPSYSYLIFVEACASERVRVISIARLPTLPPLHLRPIYVLVLNDPLGDLILGRASCLDAFSTYPVRTRLPGSAPGDTTGSPEVRPTRSSRTSVGPPQISYAHNR